MPAPAETPPPTSALLPTVTPAFTEVPAAPDTPVPVKTRGPTVTPAPKRLITARIPAPSLANNRLGERAEQFVAIYLPPSYYTSTHNYPVVYFLTGYGDDAGSAAPPLRAAMDRLVESGKTQEMMVVVASGVNSLGGSFYVNSSVTGNWEDYIVTDVVHYVDGHYRTLPQAQSRGIAGHSMGGFGALNIAIRHPEVFSAVYSLSPGLFDENGLSNSQMFASQSTIDAFLQTEAKLMSMSAEEASQKFVNTVNNNNFNTVFAYAYGIAFSSDPARNTFVNYPYARSDDQLVRDDAVWQTWESGFGGIKAEIRQYKANLLKLKALVVDYGTNDEFQWIPQGCQYFDQQLTAANIPHKVLSYKGGHQDQLRQRIEEHMLPLFLEVLAFE